MSSAITRHALANITATSARQLVVSGRVQGVGYRPFVYRVANQLGIFGSVRNGSGKVYIQAEGPDTAIDALLDAIVEQAPPLARPCVDSSRAVAVTGAEEFTIEVSSASTDADIHIPPDLFTCDDCVDELNDCSERRFRYPFINCTQCGPRYTIIEALPYDRPNTSMKDFPLCDACRHEYENPLDRRFHAQPLACAVCGPSLEFKSNERQSTDNEEAITATVDAIRNGAIVAVKGVGGYHLICDAANDDAVQRLRNRKHRPHKPFAVMFPPEGDDGLSLVRRCVRPTAKEAQRITDPARPIVLVSKREDCALSAVLAPGLRELGVFLPYSPLHHILLSEIGSPVVATSGNISGEPVITDNDDAEDRLAGVADAFLQHNRPIVRPADDAVMRVIGNRARPLRPGRGSAPIELSLPDAMAAPTIALGGHMKNTVALAWNQRALISPHMGDLDSPRSMSVFQQVIADLQDIYDVTAERLICDLHAGYASVRWAKQQPLPCITVQHHRAHASALYGEHAAEDPWIVFTWDGVGLGDDGTLWGGEAFAGRPGAWQRTASFRPLRLIGGDKAGREPWRSAAAMAWATEADWTPKVAGASLAAVAWQKDINTYQSSAAGRLFDAAASFILQRHVASFEGQGPMELESLAVGDAAAVSLPMIDDDGLLRSDWQPLLPVLMDEQIPASERAAIFHETMAQVIVDQASRIREQQHIDTVGLSGGVFQNRRLCELASSRLTQLGFDVRQHREVPANDGGLCLGQLVEVAAQDRQ